MLQLQLRQQANPKQLQLFQGGDRPEERLPFKGIRKIIANAMVKSVYTAPHVTLMDEVDVTALVALRAKSEACCREKRR